jgi:hypothetical protein
MESRMGNSQLRELILRTFGFEIENMEVGGEFLHIPIVESKIKLLLIDRERDFRELLGFS